MTNDITLTALTDAELEDVYGAGYMADAGYAVGSLVGSTFSRAGEAIEATADMMGDGLDAVQESVEDALQGFVDGLRSGMNGGAGLSEK